MTKKRPAAKHTAAGRRLIASAKQALAWAKGETSRGSGDGRGSQPRTPHRRSISS